MVERCLSDQIILSQSLVDVLNLHPGEEGSKASIKSRRSKSWGEAERIIGQNIEMLGDPNPAREIYYSQLCSTLAFKVHRRQLQARGRRLSQNYGREYFQAMAAIRRAKTQEEKTFLRARMAEIRQQASISPVGSVSTDSFLTQPAELAPEEVGIADTVVLVQMPDGVPVVGMDGGNSGSEEMVPLEAGDAVAKRSFVDRLRQAPAAIVQALRDRSIRAAAGLTTGSVLLGLHQIGLLKSPVGSPLVLTTAFALGTVGLAAAGELVVKDTSPEVTRRRWLAAGGLMGAFTLAAATDFFRQPIRTTTSKPLRGRASSDIPLEIQERAFAQIIAQERAQAQALANAPAQQ